MPYKIELNHPDYPKGMEFDLDGILVENGKSVTVTEEVERLFVAHNNKGIKDLYGHNEIVKVTGTSELSSKEKSELEGGEK